MTLRMNVYGSRLAERHGSLKCPNCMQFWQHTNIWKQISPNHKKRINGVDCTCTGSLLEWFPELTLGNLGPQRSHDDGSKVVASRFLLRSAAELMNFWSPPVTEWLFGVKSCGHFMFYFFDFQIQRFKHENKLTWLVLGEDPAARSHRVEQFTALWGL